MQKLMKHFHKNEKGFTLVELMVVVVIIGVLVAIAIPIYNTIQTTAQRNACLANQRTIGGAYQMYRAESDAGTAGISWPIGYLSGAAADVATGLVITLPDEPTTGCNPYTITAPAGTVAPNTCGHTP